MTFLPTPATCSTNPPKERSGGIGQRPVSRIREFQESKMADRSPGRILRKTWSPHRAPTSFPERHCTGHWARQRIGFRWPVLRCDVSGLHQLLETLQILGDGLLRDSRRTYSRPTRQVGPREDCTASKPSRPCRHLVGSNRTDPPLSTSEPSSDRQPITVFGMSLTISASHSTFMPMGPFAVQCDNRSLMTFTHSR